MSNKNSTTQATIAALLRKAHASKVAGEMFEKVYKPAIKELFTELNTDIINGGGYVATLKEVSTSSIDWKKFQADHPELTDEIAKYTRTTTSTRLYLK